MGATRTCVEAVVTSVNQLRDFRQVGNGQRGVALAMPGP